MKKTLAVLLASVLLLSLVGTVMAAPASLTTIPTFSISAVVKDSTVTIQTYNFPANDTFTVRMGAYGTKGVGGIVVGTQASGKGGSFTATYNIPAALAGSNMIAIRLESPTSKYYAFNWFYNNTAVVTVKPTSAVTAVVTPKPTTTAAPKYVGYPTFSIDAVVKDSKVTIKAVNFPANKNFTVRMGAYGTKGINGTIVTIQNSGTGGAFTWTYNIPAALVGSYKIAIRLEDTVSGYYAFNWFYNNNHP